jgi:hypothetical protein
LVVRWELRITYGDSGHYTIVVAVSHVPFCRAIQLMVQLQFIFLSLAV